ncbi:hypothetical protein DXG01_010470 [Tephrocybe rancida]|nr:hypothetical protein DXG01_010470 [Tephrocybe rancida]
MSLSRTDHAYIPLLTPEVQEGEKDPVPKQQPPRAVFKRITVPLWLILVIPLLELAFFASWAIDSFGSEEHCSYPNAQILYSPAAKAVEYKPVRFQSSFFGDPNDPPGVFGDAPSPEVDAAWESLYNFGISQIPLEQAQQLVNSTLPTPLDSSKYLVGIDVFHHLHCLNMIRKALHPEYYPPDSREDEEERQGHLGHCVNSLRQSLQCNADISPIIWRKLENKRILPRFDIVHSCRDFDKIREWGLGHRTVIPKKNGKTVTSVP